jgi:hypothetical protein
MSTLPVTNPTLLDLANRMDPDGSIPDIVEMLNETNEALDDVTFIEGNLTNGHKTKIRTGLPTPTWRALYQGVMPTRSTVAEVTDTCGSMEAFSEIDCREADLNGNTAEFRLSEDRPHLEGMNQEFMDTLFYATEMTNPEKFTGLSPRFNDPTAENGQNLLNGGGADADNASIWLVGWSPKTVFCMTPKGLKAGLQHYDLGKQLVDVFDADGAYTGKMMAYISHYEWHAGLCLKDWRYVVRIANVDKSALTKDASAGADLIDLMTQALELMPSDFMGATRPVFYVPQTIRSFLRRQITNKVASSTLQMSEVAGRKVVTFDDVPVRRCDALAGDEAAIVWP